MKHWTYVIGAVLLTILFEGCSTINIKPQVKFSAGEFKVLNNYTLAGDTLVMEMDLSKGPYSPISLPATNQFEFSFSIENQEDTPQSFSYKIYYQNESYKHPETINGNYNPRSAENFYGSWISDSLIHFKELNIPAGERISVTDVFNISGNPHNLDRYFGEHPADNLIKKKDVDDMMASIRQNEVWYNAIIEKAATNNVSEEEQLKADAIWNIEHRESNIHENQRWQNNPRVGSYKFMLVVTPTSVKNELPEYMQRLDGVDTLKQRVNPFYSFHNTLPKNLSNQVRVLHAKEVLKTFAVLRPHSGLLYNPTHYTNQLVRNDSECSNSEEAFATAHFMQFMNTEIRDSSLHNIDVALNVGGSNYSTELFSKNQQSTSRNIPSYVEQPHSPCVNSFYDEGENCIKIQNPGNTTRPYRKENAGIEGRFGFTYGKYTARIKFPHVLSQQGVWNGITCAFWLKFHRSGTWNNRDICEGSGYLKTGYSKEDAVYGPESDYSEIDIEIVKTSRNWPQSSYEKPDTVTAYNAGKDFNLMFTCTNWDLACDEPEDFHSGIQGIRSPSAATYFAHRWTNWYKAVTIKTENPAVETVGDVMLYQIDWNPDHITWRLGNPETGVMKEMGYMNETMTKIPNNQMVPVMSQEFHYGHWWPMTPYPQGDIPYPADPIQGALYEIVIE